MLKEKIKKYYVSIDYNETNLTLISHLDISNVVVKNEKICFKTNKKGYDFLVKNIELIEYYDINKKKISILLNKYIITIISLILFIILILCLRKTVTEIRFVNDDTYNEEVERYIKNNFKFIGPFCYQRESLNKINYLLRSNFYHYEWIGITKRGTIIFVEIVESYIDDYKEKEHLLGSIYAKKDGIIKKYHIEKGIVKVQEEEYVNKGDLLISGDIFHYNNKIEKIHPKGYIIAEVLEYQDFTIPKKILKKEYSSKIIIDREILLFNKSITKKEYDAKVYHIDKMTIFNLKNIIEIKKIYLYEKIITTNYYDETAAKRYALSMVYSNFLKNKKNKDENIVYAKYVRINEDDEYYYIRLLVKSHEDISIFYEDKA